MYAPSSRFDEDAILARARSADGLEDFGDEEFREPLRVLLRAYADAPIHDLGAKILEGSVVRSLANRLRANHWFASYPEIAEEVLEAPLVVVGMMRSGTTLIQRLLASDPRHYCTMGWESLEPAPRLGVKPTDVDPRIADADSREQMTREFAAEYFSIHPSYARQAEEEIMFLADAFLSHVPEASCDVPEYRAYIDAQDFAPAYRYLRRMLQLLQWEKKRRGEHRGRWVLKTPAHLGYLDTLIATFPDAQVIHMHRDPVDTIPSGASLNATLWRMHAADVDPAEIGRQWIARMSWTNGRAMAVRNEMSDGATRFTDVRFGAAVEDPIGQIQRIYHRTGIELHDDARDAMATWLEKYAKQTLSKHRYTAEQFGLTEDQIRAAFADYAARFLTAKEKA
ncbi:MAG: sulfotransferase [Candidatus Binatia bacterium]|nr:sulfotransferase [Candidatus Binatia bacterium]